MAEFEFPKTLMVAQGTDPSTPADRFTALDAIADFSAGETVAVYQLVRVGKIELGLTAVKKPRKPRAPKADAPAKAPAAPKAKPASKPRKPRSDKGVKTGAPARRPAL